MPAPELSSPAVLDSGRSGRQARPESPTPQLHADREGCDPRRADVLIDAALRVPAALLLALPIGMVAALAVASRGAKAAIFPFAALLESTLITTAIGVGLAAPIGLAVAAFLSDLAPRSLRRSFGRVVDVLGAVPSVVYGLWGLAVVVPGLASCDSGALGRLLHRVGFGSVAAGVVLAVMILPTIASVSREVLAAVPDAQRDAAIALGATPWDVLRVAVLPSARSGLLGAVLLGCNRAFGATMAVTLVLGGVGATGSLDPSPSPTLASALLTEITQAVHVRGPDGAVLPSAHESAVIEVALLLCLSAVAMSLTARWLIEASKRRMGTA